jgi:membrane-associated phospholipid phosphatase
VAIIVSGFITNYYKISIHMTGSGGVVGLLALLSTTSMFNVTWLLAVAVMLSGLVGVSRIQLKAHTHMQVYSGFAFGFTVIFLMGWFL